MKHPLACRRFWTHFALPFTAFVLALLHLTLPVITRARFVNAVQRGDKKAALSLLTNPDVNVDFYGKGTYGELIIQGNCTWLRNDDLQYILQGQREFYVGSTWFHFTLHASYATVTVVEATPIYY